MGLNSVCLQYIVFESADGLFIGIENMRVMQVNMEKYFFAQIVFGGQRIIHF